MKPKGLIGRSVRVMGERGTWKIQGLTCRECWFPVYVLERPGMRDFIVPRENVRFVKGKYP